MNESFEVLPFGVQPAQAMEWEQEQEWEQGQEWEQEWEDEDEQEWEDERLRRPGGGGRGRGGGLRARPPLRGPRRPMPPRYQPRRPPPRYPAYPLPYLPPRFRGWGSYPVPYPVPEPALGPEPGFDQQDEPDQGVDEGQGEVPPVLAATLGRIPQGASLQYQSLGNIEAAVKDPKGTGAGLYLIEFDTRDGRRAYSGQTDNLRRRLKQHHLCGKMMGLDMDRHVVYVAPLSSAEQRRQAEKDIHGDMFTHRRGVLTNQRRELEMEVMGETWG